MNKIRKIFAILIIIAMIMTNCFTLLSNIVYASGEVTTINIDDTNCYDDRILKTYDGKISPFIEDNQAKYRYEYTDTWTETNPTTGEIEEQQGTRVRDVGTIYFEFLNGTNWEIFNFDAASFELNTEDIIAEKYRVVLQGNYNFLRINNSAAQTEVVDISHIDSETGNEVIDETKMPIPSDIKEKFWDMFILDCLIGNTDRHNGNLGLLVKRRLQFCNKKNI